MGMRPATASIPYERDIENVYDLQDSFSLHFSEFLE